MKTAKIGGKCRNVAEIVGKFKNLWSMTEKRSAEFFVDIWGGNGWSAETLKHLS